MTQFDLMPPMGRIPSEEPLDVGNRYDLEEIKRQRLEGMPLADIAQTLNQPATVEPPPPANPMDLSLPLQSQPALPEGYLPENQAIQEYYDSPELQQNIEDTGQVLEDKAVLEQEGLEQQAQFADQYSAEIDQLAAESDAKIQDAIDGMKLEYDKYKDMQVKDFWSDKPTWTKLAAVIGVALGGYASGINKTRNFALDILNNTIENDFNRQKANIDKQFKAYSASKGNVTQIQNLYRSKMDRLKLKKVAAYEALEKNIQTKLGSVKTEAARIKGRELLLNIQQKKALARDEATASLNKLIATERKRNESRTRGLTPYQQWRIQDINQAREVVGFGQARSDRSARLMQESVASTNEVLSTLDRIKELGQDITKVWDRTRIGQIQTNISATIGKLRLPLTGPGAMTEKEQQLIRDVIGDPSKIFSLEAIQMGRLEELRKLLTRGLEEQAKVHILDYKPKVKEKTKTIKQKLYSPSRNKTKIIYSDGTEEIVDGQQ